MPLKKDVIEVEKGYCGCGCGAETELAKVNNRSKRWVKGEPLQFINGHQFRGWSRAVDYVVDAETGCWIWQGSTGTTGYGQINLKGKTKAAHRVFYEEFKGEIPEGLQLDHLCRTPSCVNPDHLEPVTQAENLRRGSHTKLTLEKAAEIRRLAGENIRRKQIASTFGVSVSTVEKIIAGEIWK